MRTLIPAAAALAVAAPALAQNPETAGEPALQGIVPEVTLLVQNSDLYGDYIVVEDARGERGRAVYMFSTDIPAHADQEPVMSCTSAKCLQDWTPVNGGVVLGEGLDRDLLGTMAYQVAEQELQIALYGGWPLYTFEMDQVPMTDAPQGQGDVSFGGEWYLLSPSGEPIQD